MNPLLVVVLVTMLGVVVVGWLGSTGTEAALDTGSPSPWRWRSEARGHITECLQGEVLLRVGFDGGVLLIFDSLVSLLSNARGGLLTHVLSLLGLQ